MRHDGMDLVRSDLHAQGRNSVSGLLGLGLVALAITAPNSSAQGFVERSSELNLKHTHRGGFDRMGSGFLEDWVQSGIALGDLDGDGDLDVVACGGVAENHIFRNDGRTFTDLTALAGIETSDFDRVPAVADFDDDGDLDLFFGGLIWGDGKTDGRGRLYRNEGGFVFTEVTHLTGPLGFGHTIHAKAVDLDLDGLVDLYLGEFHGTENAFYRNNGDGSFSEMGAAVGLDNFGSSHVVAAIDCDLDGHPNVFVGNDFHVSAATVSQNWPDVVLSGQPAGVYVDSSSGCACAEFATTMGMTFGDVDYDGLLDIYKTEFGLNFLSLNNGWPQSGVPWVRAESSYGIGNTFSYGPSGTILGREVGWGAAFRHLDLDPWIDLVLINGRVGVTSSDQRNFLYRGQSPLTGTMFDDKTREWGFFDEVDDRALSVGDVDRDGDLDLFVGAVSGGLRYFENRLDRRGQGWLRVEVATTTSAPGGGGSIVEWTDDQGFPHVRPILADAPTAGQNAGEAFFGLGNHEKVDVLVRFPSGMSITYPDTLAKTALVAHEPELIVLPSRTASTSQAGNLFTVQTFAHDANGQPLTAAASVSIDMPGLTPATPVQHIAGNEFRRSFILPNVAGEFRADVQFDGFQVLIRPRLIVTAGWDASETLCESIPASGRSRSGQSMQILINPRDAFGHSMGPGHNLALQVVSSAGSVPIALTDQGDGRYVGTVSANFEPGLHPLNLSVNGAPFSSVGVLELAGHVDVVTTLATYYEEDGSPPSPEPAAANRMRVLLIPQDAQGRRLGPHAQVELRHTIGVGTEKVTTKVERQRTGEYYFTFERDENTAEGSAAGTFEIWVNSVQIMLNSYSF